MIGIDTNVLVRHLVQDDPRQAGVAGQFFSQLTEEEPGFVSLVVLAELSWVLMSSYALTQPQVLDRLEDLLGARELEFEDSETVWRAVMKARAGAPFTDALIADTGELFGCSETVTFDRDAARLLGMRLLS